jgi:hypothetical protein
MRLVTQVLLSASCLMGLALIARSQAEPPNRLCDPAVALEYPAEENCHYDCQGYCPALQFFVPHAP